ncbi:Fur family transcriptional regulator [Pseudothermotoga sp. U03pept]|uniref:Fur family transcriptional regulator n=1 Tax=Pseudothermotoga sp. U03pept TaxID=3447012 RepID=UPI003EFE646C
MLKMTKNRENILQLIEDSSVPLSAYDVEKLSKTSLPTVYRALDFLLKTGQIKSFSLHQCNYYYSASKHKHFFICSKCKQFFPIDDCSMEEYEKALQRKMKIEIHEHFVLFTGLCTSCLKERECEVK